MPFIVINKPTENIWKTNPALGLITDFKKFKDEVGEELSSSIIKAIYYIWDPKSDLRDSAYTEEEVTRDISLNILGDENFDWSKYEHIRDLYLEKNITALERKMMDHEREMEKTREFLSKWTLSKDDIRDRITTVASFNKMMDELIEIKEKVDVERKELTDMFGGYQKSLLERAGED